MYINLKEHLKMLTIILKGALCRQSLYWVKEWLLSYLCGTTYEWLRFFCDYICMFTVSSINKFYPQVWVEVVGGGGGGLPWKQTRLQTLFFFDKHKHFLTHILMSTIVCQ